MNTAQSKKERKLGKITDNDNVVGYIFILPFVIGFLAFTLYPIISSFYFSFTRYDLLSSPRFIGLENYKEMFIEDPKFWHSFGITCLYVVVSVPLRLIFALLVAMILSKTTKLTGLYRAVYYIPSLLGGSVAVSVLWKRIFSDTGAVNAILRLFGIYSDTNWIGNPDTALLTLILLAVWQFGSSMLIFLAGLKQIPRTYYEAADVDGAKPVQKFFKITLPMLSPVIFFNLVMQTITGFMTFTQTFIISNGSGAPLDSLLLYALYLYQQAFGYYRMGYGSAMAWFMLFIIGALTALAFKTSSSWVYYESKEE
ncbi:ABC transporter permease [Thermoclostridium stercorarium subsp. leptospartum DSM 9219]|uniref:ABC transporter permease n=1 Tax=Thermoclostridium stercorarium subsp. leptospartum DSM 9219 TaxID=1346611 RepID=A0A1B1YMW2_THEST|nr:sugar ABC transporter permease [Thermoclostridium stercorarium]ANX02098.1 ABC transporter permease [Thermoclostridium stercorarium subsp. leptospartum DSM 9219]